MSRLSAHKQLNTECEDATFRNSAFQRSRIGIRGRERRFGRQRPWLVARTADLFHPLDVLSVPAQKAVRPRAVRQVPQDRDLFPAGRKLSLVETVGHSALPAWLPELHRRSKRLWVEKPGLFQGFAPDFQQDKPETAYGGFNLPRERRTARNDAPPPELLCQCSGSGAQRFVPQHWREVRS